MKPIIFSTPMVQAILDGRKTQTRRVIKPQPAKEATQFERFIETVDCGLEARFGSKNSSAVCDRKPQYKPGDILWVRETWRIGAWNEDIGCIAVDYKADNYARREWIRIKDEERFKRYWIESTDDAIKAGVEPDENGEYHWEPGQAPTKWRPSIHMPREAARIFLLVKDVRVERLQDITEEDAKAEGCYERLLNDGWKNIGKLTARDDFIMLWEYLNAKRGYGWDTNPWVWVVKFERISKDEAYKMEGLRC